MRRTFADRTDAGRQLAGAVADLGLVDPVVLGLPRGGVPVAFEVAEELDAPLDVLVVRKIGAPRQRELAIGAVAEGGELLVDAAAARAVAADELTVDELVRRERAEIERNVDRFRAGRPLPDLGGRDVVIVDDGLATGLTAEVAISAMRLHGPRTLTLATPVGAPDSIQRLQRLADVVCLLSPPRFLAVGLWYQRFDQTTDDEVVALLARRRRPSDGQV